LFSELGTRIRCWSLILALVWARRKGDDASVIDHVLWSLTLPAARIQRASDAALFLPVLVRHEIE
jgi:hypothetical protein